MRKRARSVNINRCTGCGSCVEYCPVTNFVKSSTQPLNHSTI
ncbi:MAG: 4Fe-4S binding protein [Candidatus Thermoplasmatota archaeon]|nr:4Fe-4S binding protein [Candidatus Thermoplasmatota archaeon]